MLTTIALASLFATEAQACGGFFCNTEELVEQAGEKIVFAIDDETDTVEVHVQIAYEGPAEQFAWVVPAPKQPELFLSAERLFRLIDPSTRPLWNKNHVAEGDCSQDLIIRANGSDTSCWNCDFDAAVAESNESVVVVDSKQVGPYDTVTLQADSAENLLTWLQDNDYDIPSSLAPVLDPYVAGESYFVALRLTKGASTGDIAPLGLRYEGTKATIPIQLTSVAATPDMPVTVWVLGSDRAVPDNYLHLEVNEVGIDWFNDGANYTDVITAAANEAGGQGFATDMASPTLAFHDTLAVDGQWADARTMLQGASDPSQFMIAVQQQGLSADGQLLDILTACMGLPSDLDATAFLNCPDCYSDRWDELGFSAQTCADNIMGLIIEPTLAADALIERHPYLTRLTSSMSADEMTVDPEFALNAEMPDVDRMRTATLYFECKDGGSAKDAPRRLELPSGLMVPLPSANHFTENGIDYLDWVAEPAALANQTVARTAATGTPEFVVDNSDEISRMLQALASESSVEVGGGDSPAGCGCSSTTTGGMFAVFLGLLALPRRRR